MQEPLATILAVLIVLIVLAGVFLMIREFFRLPGHIAGFFNNYATARRKAEHEEALAAGFTPKEIAAVDAQQDKLDNRVGRALFGVLTFVGMIALSIAAFAMLGPFALIIVIPKWAWYLKWAVGKLNSSEA